MNAGPQPGARLDIDGVPHEFFVDEYQRRWWRRTDEPTRLIAYAVAVPPVEKPSTKPCLSGYMPNPMFG